MRVDLRKGFTPLAHTRDDHLAHEQGKQAMKIPLLGE
jgi:hypothetical protein